MTIDQITHLLPQYNNWKLNIAFWYGEEYANLYCTWKRFLEHIETLKEVVDEGNNKGS